MDIKHISLLVLLLSFLCFAQDNKKSELFIKDSSNYSKVFINCLEAIGQQQFSLIDSFLIINSSDTTIIPQLKNDSAKFSDGNNVLILKQINYSTIKYWFITPQNQFEGLASINCAFYLGYESDTDINGDSYFCDEFIDSNSNNNVIIRVGEEYCNILIGNNFSRQLKYHRK